MCITASIRRVTACGVLAFLFASCGEDDSYAGERGDQSNVPPVDGDQTGGIGQPGIPGAGNPQRPAGANDPNTNLPGANRNGERGPNGTGVMDAAPFVQQAASSGMFEVQAAELALQQGNLSEGVRTLAQRLRDDHQKANQELKSIASELNVQVPETMAEKHQTMLRELRDTTGQQFESKFLEQQRKAHEEAIQLFERASLQLPAGRLQSFAKATTPVLRQHLDAVQQQKPGAGNGGTGR